MANERSSAKEGGRGSGGETPPAAVGLLEIAEAVCAPDEGFTVAGHLPSRFFLAGADGTVGFVHLCMKRVLDVGKVVPLIWPTSYEYSNNECTIFFCWLVGVSGSTFQKLKSERGQLHLSSKEISRSMYKMHQSCDQPSSIGGTHEVDHLHSSQILCRRNLFYPRLWGAQICCFFFVFVWKGICLPAIFVFQPQKRRSFTSGWFFEVSSTSTASLPSGFNLHSTVLCNASTTASTTNMARVAAARVSVSMGFTVTPWRLYIYLFDDTSASTPPQKMRV